tara:strand:- start:1921 stop:2778 length:858 start_codon:yes stop_codon:yes gene_type:complete
MIKFFIYFLQSILIYLFFVLGKIMGLNLSRKVFSWIFCVIGPVFKSKKIIDKNLHIFSKNISDDEKKQITKSMWSNYGKTFIEYIHLNILKKEDSHIQILGENNLMRPIHSGKPVIFISGHFANFELMSMEITKKKINLATIYRPLNNFFLNPLMEYLRKKYICRNQIKKGIKGVREAIEYIQKKNSIALMVDQRVSEGEKINLFNKPALTTTLPAQLALKYKLEIIPVFIERKEDDNFIIEFSDPIQSDKFRDKLDLSLKLNNILESMIVKNPKQWIWTHNRWK